MKPIKKSVLLKTSAGTDIQHSGGTVTIAGLPEVRYNEIRKIRQIKSRDEVVQVVTVGSTSYTPTANTRYAVEILDPEMKREGYTGVSRVFGYTTPAVVTTMGASAALQREYIHGKIVTAINLSTAYTHITAATLGSGNGFTLTDSAGYYPANANGGAARKGANVVIAKTNSDATGFTDSDVTVTTAAVYAFGNGTTLAANAPVIAAYSQLLVSGDLEAPVASDGTYATAGQKYDAFLISANTTAPAHSVSGQLALVPQEFAVFVDNGTGTVTTNLSGFKAFRREAYRLVASLYRRNPSSTIDFFGKPIMMEGALGAAPATTGTYKLLSEEMWQVTQIGTQTVVGPVIGNTGLLLDQDLTDTEGAEYVPSILTNDAREFVVGKTPFSLTAEVVCADWTDMAILVGFRKKAAHAADFNDYTDLAAVGSLAASGDLFTTQGILNNAATVSTSTAVVPVDATSVLFEVLVDKAGLVTCKINGTAYDVYSTGTTDLVLDAGDSMIPFLRAVNISGGDPDAVVSQFFAIADDSWKA